MSNQLKGYFGVGEGRLDALFHLAYEGLEKVLVVIVVMINLVLKFDNFVVEFLGDLFVARGTR